ncbi:MAG: archease [Armatimonadota bacterium]|nr:archease [Armatimonadota bacterium]MDR7548340.1 archease [Armatimonadota bacterium]
MGEYEVIDHTADVGITVRATSLHDLFETAAEGMFSFIVDPTSVENRAWLERRVEADDLPGLLVAWLNDLLNVLSAESFVPKVFVVDEVGEGRLRATLHGEPTDPARHRFRLDVKAATYHGLEVSETDGRWMARVIFDV